MPDLFRMADNEHTFRSQVPALSELYNIFSYHLFLSIRQCNEETQRG